MLTKIIKWFIYSSRDPQQLALTLKAGIPFLMLLGLGGYVTEKDAVDIIDFAVNLIMLSTQWFTGAVTLYGAVRKVVLTIRG